MNGATQIRRWTIAIAVCVLLWVGSFAWLDWFVVAANQQQTLTAEEASSTFVNVAFLEHRLQHHRLSTNFYGYVLFWLGSRVLGVSLFYGRVVKAVWISLLPVLMFLYLWRRKSLAWPYAMFAAALTVLIPGVISTGFLAMDTGMDAVFGMAALLLAGYSQPRIRLISPLLLGTAILTYGSGLYFVPAVLYEWFRRSPSRVWWLWAGALLCAPALAAILWWTNVQTLVVGGGKPSLTGIGPNLLSMALQLFWRGDSYYFFSNRRPALGNPLLAAAGVAGLWFARRESRDLLMLAGTAIMLYAITGGVIGVRRLVPLELALICGVVLLTARLPKSVAGVAAVAALAVLMFSAVQQRKEIAEGRIVLPHDFEFRLLPGQTQQQTFASLAAGGAMPTDGYEADRTGSVLYLLTGGRLPDFRTLTQATDAHGWSIKSDAPRFQWLRRRLAGHDNVLRGPNEPGVPSDRGQ